MVSGLIETPFGEENSDSKNEFSEINIMKMLDFTVNNIIVGFVGKVFQQTIWFPMGINCSPLLTEPCSMRNETEKKRNETKEERNEAKQIEKKKRNKSKQKIS